MTRRRQVWVTSLLCVAGLLGPSQPEVAGVSPDKPGAASTIVPWKGPAPHIVIETDRGKLTLELYPDAAPRTVARFVELVKKGFYNGLTFHRVVPKFLIQGGDPAGDGTGGSGLPIPAEFSEKKHGTGTVGPGLGGLGDVPFLREHDARLVRLLFLQMRDHVGMVHRQAADEPREEAVGAEPRS